MSSENENSIFKKVYTSLKNSVVKTCDEMFTVEKGSIVYEVRKLIRDDDEKKLNQSDKNNDSEK